jgi:hypothetical protein
MRLLKEEDLPGRRFLDSRLIRLTEEYSTSPLAFKTSKALGWPRPAKRAYSADPEKTASRSISQRDAPLFLWLRR